LYDKKTEEQVLICCQGQLIELSHYLKIDAFIL